MTYGVVGLVLSALAFAGGHVFDIQQILEPVAYFTGGFSLLLILGTAAGDEREGDACGGGGGCGGGGCGGGGCGGCGGCGG